MTRSFRSRLADAACAFQTGHSVRDLRRTRLRRLVLLARRISAEKRRDAGKVGLEWLASRLTARADALDDAAQRCVRGFDRKSETLVLNALYIELTYLRACRWNESLDRMGLENADDAVDDDAEIVRIPFRELGGNLYQGFFEDGRLDFLFDEHLVGRWDWHVFLRWLKGVLRPARPFMVRVKTKAAPKMPLRRFKVADLDADYFDFRPDFGPLTSRGRLPP